jgi:hypothetical protein
MRGVQMIHKYGEETKTNPTCKVCGVELIDENWAPSYQKKHDHICKTCDLERQHLWRIKNPEKYKAQWTRNNRKQGKQPINENKECASYLGVYVAECVLSQAFNNVKQMPYGNPGYDFICNKGYMVDVKSSCLHRNGAWLFHITHNTIADYFLCLAFDNREDLNPLHVWLIPGCDINDHISVTIYETTVDKWQQYERPIDQVTTCCNIMKQNETGKN